MAKRTQIPGNPIIPDPVRSRGRIPGLRMISDPIKVGTGAKRGSIPGLRMIFDPVGLGSLAHKNYNVGTKTSPSTSNPAVADILGATLYGGTGGGGDQVVPTEKVSFLSSIPTIVWVILAVGGGYFLLKKM